MSRLEIRYGSVEDTELIANLAASTFWDTYHENEKVDTEFIKAYMEKAFSREQIEKELGEPEITYLIAEVLGETAGFAKLIEKSDLNGKIGGSPLEISRIYLKSEFIGRGYGRIMLERCIDEASANNCDAVWLSVWRHNHRAIRFYEKNVFKKVGTHIFDLAGRDELDFVMERKLEDKSG